MKKITTLILSVFVLIILAVLVNGGYSLYKKQPTSETPIVTEPVKVITPAIATAVKNMSYTIDNGTYTLTNGTVSKEAAPGSASKETLSLFGEPIYGDLNGDGVNDAAVTLVYNGGGSGTFYYAVLVMASGTTYTSTNALILGDRIAPQTVEIQNGRAIYNYAERKANEPMTTQPSVGKSLFIHYDVKTKTIGELVQNFEGEADPNRMTLGMKKWSWVKTQMNDGKVTTPKKTDVFTLTFAKDGRVSVTTDCNGMGGNYTVAGKKLTFSQMISTMMYCDGSQEQEFAAKLQDTASYLFTSKGELILEIKMDSGTMTFK